jgi:type I restriction enzyme M protein
MPKDTNYPTRRRGQSKDKAKSNGATLGFEEKLRLTADKLRGHMDPAEYKHVVLGLVFLKYVSDAFAERHTWLLREAADPKSDYYVKQERGRYELAEERDEYTAENIFWVPRQARRDYLQDRAKQPTIGKLIDDATPAIEKENASLKGVLSKDYARPALDRQRLSAPIRSGWALRHRRLRICLRALFAAL